MEHGLYLKLEKIVDKLANEKGCMVADPKDYKGEIKTALFDRKIPFGKDKGKIEYYDAYRAMDFTDFIKKCFAILPRDNLQQLSNGLITKTGVTMDSLLSDKNCSEEERTRQKLVINRFFRIANVSGDIR